MTGNRLARAVLASLMLLPGLALAQVQASARPWARAA